MRWHSFINGDVLHGNRSPRAVLIRPFVLRCLWTLRACVRACARDRVCNVTIVTNRFGRAYSIIVLTMLRTRVLALHAHILYANFERTPGVCVGDAHGLLHRMWVTEMASVCVCGWSWLDTVSSLRAIAGERIVRSSDWLTVTWFYSNETLFCHPPSAVWAVGATADALKAEWFMSTMGGYNAPNR